MKRHLIKVYDLHRSENYNFDNCKHLACTEVRAAHFDSKCNPRERAGDLSHRISRMNTFSSKG